MNKVITASSFYASYFDLAHKCFLIILFIFFYELGYEDHLNYKRFNLYNI